MLRSFGAEIRYNQRFLDHHRFSDEEVQHVFDQAEAAQLDLIVTTEKDAVRLSATQKAPLPFYFLRLEIDILSGGDDFDSAVDRICFAGSEVRQSIHG
jgi:tetraacyldisaccharide 4'-kinase